MNRACVLTKFILVLLALSLILGLFSCSKKEEEGDSTGSESESESYLDSAEDTEADTDTESDTDTEAESESEEESSDTVVEDISFKDYTLVRPDKASDRLLDEISEFYGALMTATGNFNSFTTDYIAGGGEPDPEALEILIGHTSRPETEEVLSQLSGDEYAVAVVGKKIVIAGSTDSITVAAVQYFVENYLENNESCTLAGDLFYKASADVALLVDKGTINCEIVRSDTLEHMNNIMLKKLYNITRASAGVAIPTISDAAESDPNKIQVLFGYTDYAETMTVREQTPPEEFTIDFIDNKIVIFAWTAEAMQRAVDTFTDILAYSCYMDDSGKTTVCILKERITSSDSDISYFKDVPTKAGGNPVDSIYDAYDNTMMLYWRSVGADAYTSYISELKTKGFTVYQSNPESESVVSATLVKDKATVHVYYLKRTSELRVTTRSNMALPINPYAYEKVCDVAVTQLGLDYTTDTSIVGGMGYLIRLEDGSFVVIDGGDATAKGKENLKNAENLYELMIAQKPESVEDVVISAWIITHGHGDHFGVYNLFAKYYTDKVTVKTVVGNELSDFIYENLSDPYRSFDHASRAKAFAGCEYIKLHTGQSLYLPGVTFNALYTHEDVYPNYMQELNSAATVVLDAIVAGEEKDTRILFLADLTEIGAGRFVEMYSEKDIKSDILQVAHHGNMAINGKSANCKKLYVACAPEIALWPAAAHYPDQSHIKGQPQNAWLFENVATIIRSGDGNYTITFGKKVSIDDGATGSPDDGGDYTQRY